MRVRGPRPEPTGGDVLVTGEPGVGKTVLLDRPQRRGTPGGARCANTRLFIVGSPKVTTPVIEAAPLAALDLPLRVVVREDGYQTEDQLPRHRPRLRAGTGSTPIWPGHWRASTRGPAPW